MRLSLLVLAALSGFTGSFGAARAGEDARTGNAAATVKATFLGAHTYTTDAGCKKLAAIAAGGPENVGTIPETLTADGFSTFEGGCSFLSITDKGRGVFVARMACSESADESEETDTFTLLPGDRVNVSVDGKDTMFQRCDSSERK